MESRPQSFGNLPPHVGRVCSSPLPCGERNSDMEPQMRHRLRLVLAMFIALLLISGALYASTTIAASNSNEVKVALTHRIGGQPGNWQVLRDSYGNFVGAKFDSNVDTRLRAPRQGRLDTACGQVWSGPNVTRRITVTVATFWREGTRTKLTRCALTPAKAARKYHSGDGTAQFWTLISGSENTGWVYDGPSVSLYSYHGHVDHEFGTTSTGNWTPAVTKATGWYWN